MRLALLGLLLLSCTTAFAQEPNLAGDWNGSVTVQGVTLRLVVHVMGSPGAYTATLDSPDQGATGVPFDAFTVSGSSVTISLAMANAYYQGTVNADGTQISGVWAQNGMSLPCTFVRQGGGNVEVAPPDKPVEKPKPKPYDEEEVTYDNEAAGITFAGTLTIPRAQGPFPAVLLITGSGPQDRDETVFGHKTFAVLADYLTRRNIVVLRVDDRGMGKSTGSMKDATLEDFVGDVLAGVDYLKTRREVNAKKIGLIGHSEGGLTAPLAATRSKDVAFIVLMAGPGVTGEEILLEQAALIGKAEGTSPGDIEKNAEVQRAMFAIVKTEKDPAVAETKLREVLAEKLGQMEMAKTATPEQIKAQIDSQVRLALSPWFKYFVTYDPRPTLRKVTIPVLAVNGQRDLQVPPKQNLPEIEKALKAGGNKDFAVKELKGLNHLFLQCETGAISEYATIKEEMDESALKTIGDWIAAHTGKVPAKKPVPPKKKK